MANDLPLPPGRSGLPLIGETLTYLGNGFEFIEERTRRHGPVFRTHLLGKKTVIIVGPESSSAFVDPANIKRAGAQPGFLYRLFAGPSMPHMDDEEHRRRKTLVLEAFSRPALESYLAGLEGVVQSAAERWASQGELDSWLPELKRISIEGICNSFLGLEAGPRLEGIVRDYDLVSNGIGGIPVALPGTRYRAGLEARDRILPFLMETIREHQRRPDDPAPDGVSRILKARLPDGAAIEPDGLMRELHHIVIAGFIIFAEFALTLVELDRQPDLRRRLEEEIDRVDGAKSGPLSLDLLERMPLLTRVVMEVKRLCPILPALFGLARRSFDLHGYTIPEGWAVLWGWRSSHLDPAIYAEPLKFDPARFAEPRSEQSKHEHAFAPQGPGPELGHRCPGETYATCFMQVFLLVLLRGGYRWTFPLQDMDYRWNLTPPEPKGGLRVQFGKG